MHGGRIYEYAHQTGRDIAEVVDFSANINPLGPPDTVWEAIQLALPLIRHYPDVHHTVIKQSLAQRFNVPAESIVCGNGASEVMELLLRQLQPRRIWILEPAFSEYADIARRIGVPVCRLPLFDGTRFALPLQALSKRIDVGDCVVINTPHNPSGHHFSKAQWFAAIADWTRSGVCVMVDESFIDFLPAGEKESTLMAAARTPHLFTIRSATKIFSIPGLRFGFAVMHEQMARTIEQARDGWSVNVVAQAAAKAAYEDAAFLAETRAWLDEAHRFVAATWYQAQFLKTYRTDVNFLLAQLNSDEESRALQSHLLQLGMPVRDCASFQRLGNPFIRVALRTKPENERLWDAVSHFLGDRK